jgi:hypothetical protein
MSEDEKNTPIVEATIITPSKQHFCTQCTRNIDPKGNWYEIAHYFHGTRRRATRICSVFCLVNWAYNYGVVQGVQGVNMLKQALFKMVTNAVKK